MFIGAGNLTLMTFRGIRRPGTGGLTTLSSRGTVDQRRTTPNRETGISNRERKEGITHTGQEEGGREC